MASVDPATKFNEIFELLKAKRPLWRQSIDQITLKRIQHNIDTLARVDACGAFLLRGRVAAEFLGDMHEAERCLNKALQTASADQWELVVRTYGDAYMAVGDLKGYFTFTTKQEEAYSTYPDLIASALNVCLQVGEFSRAAALADRMLRMKLNLADYSVPPELLVSLMELEGQQPSLKAYIAEINAKVKELALPIIMTLTDRLWCEPDLGVSITYCCRIAESDVEIIQRELDDACIDSEASAEDKSSVSVIVLPESRIEAAAA